MCKKISKKQYDNLLLAKFCDKHEYHKLLKEYTGIVAKPYTAFEYYDYAGDYVGNSENYDLYDLLENAFVEVDYNGK